MHAQSKTYKNLALFDFDGTLCCVDSFTKFIFFAFPKLYIYKKGITILPWIIAYYIRLYPAHLMRPKLFQTLFKNTSQPEIDKMAEEYAHLLLEKYLNLEIYAQLKQHQALGDDVILVSASIDIYLKYICQILNIELICSLTEIKNSQYTGQYTSEDCSHEQKKMRVIHQYAIDQYQQIFAYGNSHEDHAMLSMADIPYLTTQKTALPQLMQTK
jgi:HAD superfamily hydrolase (TIGR01490 family)